MAIYVRWRLRRSPRIRRGDESPDGDLALPCPRRSLASPGVASATSPTLRVSSSRRSRMRPSPHTNFHESLKLALRHLATFPMSSSLRRRGRRRYSGSAPQSLFPLPILPHSPFYILHFTFPVAPIRVAPQGRIRVSRRRHSWLGGRRKPAGLAAARHIPRRTLSMSW